MKYGLFSREPFGSQEIPFTFCSSSVLSRIMRKMVGYRADDSYFSFAEDFINNTISLRDLNMAMQLGTLGEQIVLLSPKAFGGIQFLGYEIVDYREYYYKRSQRDQKARADYQQRKKDLLALREDIFALDIMREDMKNDAPRLQSHISG